MVCGFGTFVRVVGIFTFLEFNLEPDIASFGFIGLGFLLLSWILSVSGVCGAFVIVLILIAGFSSSYGLF